MIPTNNTIPYRATPAVTYALIGACVAAFLYQLTLSSAVLERFLIEYALVPARYTSGVFAEAKGLSRGDPLPFVTSMFLHGGLLHILSNMWTLWIFGPALEDRLGRARYLALYLLAGLAAGLTHFVFNFRSEIPTLGASGAIAGVLGAYARRFPYAWINVLQPIGIMPVFLYMPAMIFAGFWFLTQIFQAAGSLIPGAAGGVAWWAHVGGFVLGWVLVKRISPPADPAEESRAATRSLFWPWEMWTRWMTWWFRR